MRNTSSSRRTKSSSAPATSVDQAPQCLEQSRRPLHLVEDHPVACGDAEHNAKQNRLAGVSVIRAPFADAEFGAAFYAAQGLPAGRDWFDYSAVVEAPATPTTGGGVTQPTPAPPAPQPEPEPTSLELFNEVLQVFLPSTGAFWLNTWRVIGPL